MADKYHNKIDIQKLLVELVVLMDSVTCKNELIFCQSGSTF